MHGHIPYTVEKCRGLYQRPSAANNTQVPNGYLTEAQNVRYRENNVINRDGVSTLFEQAGFTIRRFHRYNKISGAKYIVLGSNGNVYDAADLTTPILTGVGSWTDFSGITLYDRFYFCGHDRSTGISGSFLYVWSGTGTARKAAGAKPASAVTAAVSATAGNIETGNRIYYVAYETDTGHITMPNATGTILNSNVANRSVDLSAIPTGPAGTAKRHLLCTKRTDPYSGNPDDYEVFFIPNGIIANNVGTTLTVNFFDADLVDSADYLFDELEEIPAFLALAHYSGRLCGSAPSGSTGIVRISKSGFPESFSSVDGFTLVDPSDGGDVRGLLPQSSRLYCFKDDRTYYSFDNGEEPANWPVNQLESGLGSSVFGVAKMIDSEGPSEDVAFVATKAGIYLFNNGFAEIPLTWPVESIWKLNLSSFNNCQIIVDTVNKELYTLDGNGKILVGNFRNGLSVESMQWSVYAMNSTTVTGLAYYNVSGNFFILYKSSDDSTAKINKLGPDTSIESGAIVVVSMVTDPSLPTNTLNHFNGLWANIRLTNSTALSFTWTKHGVGTVTTQPTVTMGTGLYRLFRTNIKTTFLGLKIQFTVGGSDPAFGFAFPYTLFYKQIGYRPSA